MIKRMIKQVRQLDLSETLEPQRCPVPDMRRRLAASAFDPTTDREHGKPEQNRANKAKPRLD
jgi:hypothetical protein